MKKVISFILIILSIFVLSSCKKQDYKYVFDQGYFNTAIVLELYNVSEKEFIESITCVGKMFEHYHYLTDRYVHHGLIGINYINNHPNEVIEISSELYALIKYSIDIGNTYKDENDNPYFNILIGSVSNLYYNPQSQIDFFTDDNGETGKTINENELPNINGNYNFNINEIELTKDPYTIKIKDGMSIDLGGIAKGYTSEKAKEFLLRNNIDFTLNSGTSSIYTSYGNPNRDNSAYNIGLTDPMDTSTYFDILTIYPNECVSVSGDYQKYFICNNRIYSHILDANTRESVITDIRSISIVTDKLSDGDILSTILFMMGSVKANNFMIENNIRGVIYISSDNIIKVNIGE